MKRFGFLALAALLVAIPATRLSAQTDPRLVAAVRMAAAGSSDGDSARAQVEQLLSATPVTDSLYPQILYTKGMIANSASERQHAFQRVVVEFGSSNWADKALFRLAQVAYASGDPAGATRYLDRIRDDYPASSVLGEASYWAARIYRERNDVPTSCRWVTLGLEHAGSDVELTNRLNFLKERCESLAAGDTAPPSQPAATPAPPPPAAQPPAAAPKAVYQVQVAAVSTRSAADEVATRVRAAGVAVDVVHEGNFYKVRAGSYQTRAEAQAGVGQLKAKLGGQPFIVHAP